MVPAHDIGSYFISLVAIWTGWDEVEGDRSREGVKHVAGTGKTKSHRHPLYGSALWSLCLQSLVILHNLEEFEGGHERQGSA